MGLYEKRADFGDGAHHAFFATLHTSLDIRGRQVIGEFDAEIGHDLVRREMDGEQAVHLLHRRVIGGDGQDRRLHVGQRRLAHQQPLALAGQENRRHPHDQADADRSHSVELGHAGQFGGQYAGEGNDQAEQSSAILEQYGIDAGILAAADRGDVAEIALAAPEFPERDPPGASLEQEAEAEHDIVDDRVLDRHGRKYVGDALVEGDAGAQREDKQRDYETPEIELAAVAERMQKVRQAPRAPQSMKQQQAISGVDQRMDAFGKHRRASRQQGGREFRQRDQQIARQRRVDDLGRAGMCRHHLPRRDEFSGPSGALKRLSARTPARSSKSAS